MSCYRDWENLRACTGQQNTWNTRPYGKSGVKGVFLKGKKFVVRDHNDRYVCTLDDFELAAAMATKFRTDNHGEFAYGG